MTGVLTLVIQHWSYNIGHLITNYLMTGHWYSSGGIGQLAIMSLLTNVRVDFVDLLVSGGRHWSAVTDDLTLVIQHWSYNIGHTTLVI